MNLIFWASLLALGYTFWGYPQIAALMARLAPRRPSAPGSPAQGKLKVVLVVHNERDRIRARLENLFAQESPPEQIIVVSDGSTDDTQAVVAGLGREEIRFIACTQRRGKSACLNIGVKEAAPCDILVFTDVRQRFDPGAISRLLARFADPQVGAVSGALEIEASSNAIAHGVGTYWTLEKRLRFDESRWNSSVGCTGAIYAIRAALYREIPPDTLLDDVLIPMQIVQAGYRVQFEPNAIAYDPQSLDPEREEIRKRRTLSGNFQLLFRYPGWLLPWKNPIWLQLISHKYCRLASPVFLLAALASSLWLSEDLFYRVAFSIQMLLYAGALAGRLGLKIPLASLAASFVFLNWMVARGFVSYLAGDNQGPWERAGERRASE